MKISVAELLKQSLGTTTNHEVKGTIGDIDDSGNSYDTNGEIELLRTDKGILVRCTIQMVVNCTCSRCLENFDTCLSYAIEEDYIQTVDVFTGAPINVPEESPFIIDKDQNIDLSEALRQNALLALPMKPLCQPDCAGLCPSCGMNMNYDKCSCRQSVIDPRWAGLEKLLSSQSETRQEQRS